MTALYLIPKEVNIKTLNLIYIYILRNKSWNVKLVLKLFYFLFHSLLFLIRAFSNRTGKVIKHWKKIRFKTFPFVFKNAPAFFKILFRWFLRLEVSGRTAVVSWIVASRICSMLLVAFLCSSRQGFSQYVLSASMWCIRTVVLIQLLLGRNPLYFIG